MKRSRKQRQRKFDGGGFLGIVVFVAVLIWALNVMAAKVWHVDIKPLPANGSDLAP